MRRQNSRRGRTTPQEPIINITPLIDVVFVVLIAFIVIAPLLEMDRVALAQGSKSHHAPVHFQDAGDIQIHVYEDNQIAFNNEKVSLDELIPLLQQARQQFPKARPQLFHDKKAYFGTYQAVKNRLEESGFEEMDIVLSPS